MDFCEDLDKKFVLGTRFYTAHVWDQDEELSRALFPFVRPFPHTFILNSGVLRLCEIKRAMRKNGCGKANLSTYFP